MPNTNVWLIYDGQCPICNGTANALKIKAAAGTLVLINAREPHPILEELKQANMNIDEGMVVKMNDVLYHGADAQYMLAMIGTNEDWFNRLNVIIFSHKTIAKIIYPILKQIRNLVLKVKGISKINNLGNP